jgi:hypothetical protein
MRRIAAAATAVGPGEAANAECLSLRPGVWVVGCLVAVVLFVAPAHAQCVQTEFMQIDLPGQRFYVFDYGNPPRHEFPWVIVDSVAPEPGVYRETNGQESLQRGGTSWILGDFDNDPCLDSPSPDELWL